MDKETLLKRYRLLGSKLAKKKRIFQIKQLKDCMELIKISFDPEFDGRHSLVQKLCSLNEGLMEADGDVDKIKKYGEAMSVVAACIAFFQEAE